MAGKKRNSGRNFKAKKNSTFSFWKGCLSFFLTLFILGLGIIAYEYRDGFLYYLGFKTNKNIDDLSPSERKIADIRIYEVLQKHADKVYGFDVSEYQGAIKWDELGKVEDTFALSFVFVRATAGKDRVDSRFKDNWEGAREAELVRGAYHYYRPNENSLEQAQNFIANVPLGVGDLPPVLDIEQLPKKQSIDSLKVGLRRWLTAVEKHYKVKPIIYSGESYYNDFLKESFSDYPFWIANYNFWRQEPDVHWLLWQFTEKAKVEGVPSMIDLNVFNGSKIDLRNHIMY
ncbi:glycoside hydrolase family 25 protein [Flavobacterium chuncheonense]|uniref:Glycoside hydrolase family 25 protein n=1 Tax=Flavobacterium chuncheonense TaxID=2026653 RepID=A0ABW5YIZ9_9FLAO